MAEGAPSKPGKGAKVLVVEDEIAVAELLKEWLRDAYEVFIAYTGQEGLQLFARNEPDLAILDILIPNMGGLELIRTIRFASAIPILVLSARGREEDKEAALDLGADDYVVKPVGRKELLARVGAALQWTTQERSFAADQPYSDDAITIDFARREVTVDGRSVALTKIEYLLLTTLIRHAGQTLTYDQLLDSVWGPEYDSPQYVTWHIGRLRRKVERDPDRPERIVTVRSVGYRYDGPSAAER